MWMLGALITGFIAMEGQGVPFLPGILIYVAGKTLTSLGRRGASEEEDGAKLETSGSIEPKPTPKPTSQPASEPRPVSRRNEYLEGHPKPVEPDESAEAAFELPDLEKAILEAPPPLTSEEMIAEARRRFGPRHLEEED